MKTAQLIKVTETTLYLKEGIVISEQLTAAEKLNHSIFGETKTMKIEECIMKFRANSRKEFDAMFWDYMESEKVDSRDYYLIIDSY